MRLINYKVRQYLFIKAGIFVFLSWGAVKPSYTIVKPSGELQDVLNDVSLGLCPLAWQNLVASGRSLDIIAPCQLAFCPGR